MRTVYRVLCTVYQVLCVKYCVPSTEYCVLCVKYGVPCTKYCVIGSLDTQYSVKSGTQYCVPDCVLCTVYLGFQFQFRSCLFV